MNKLFLFLIPLIISMSGCQKLYTPLEDSASVQRKPVSRVNEIYLYKDDIIGLVPKETSAQDSAILVSKYVDTWVKKQLMIERAYTELEFDEATIERKVLDYRYALMIHEFEKFYINQRLDRDITDEEITNYYNEKFENFVLRQNIIRCLFAIIPNEAPQIENFRKIIRAYPKTNLEEIQSYCYRFASKSSLESELWLNFDEVIASTPMANIQDKVTFLKNNSYVEMSDENQYYFIRLLDYKISDQISPLEYIRDDIESILINKKKIELRKQLEDDIFRTAKEYNDFEIYK